jgi:hypothetical protein
MVASTAARNVEAQSASAHHPAPVAGDVVADTGDFASGNRDFSRYASPVMCVQAAQLTAHRLASTIRAQAANEVLRYMPFRDSIPAGVIAIARACGARFTAGDPQFTGPYGLSNLRSWFVLSLLAMHDALADTIQRRILDSATTGDERNRSSLWVLDQYLQARPVRLDAGKALAAKIDASGRPNLLTSVLGHNRLLNLADTAFDRAMIRDEADHVIALGAGLTAQEQCFTGGITAVIHAFTSELTVSAVDRSDALAGIIRRLQTHFRIPAVQECVELRKNTMFPLPDYSKMSEAEIVQNILAENVGLVSVLPEQVKKRGLITGPKWFPASGHDGTVPAPGKATMIVFLPTDMRWREREYEPENTTLRRWIAHYGPAGLAVAVLAAPHGNALWGGPESSEQLGKSFDWYYHDYLRLPVTFGLDTASRLPSTPEPDGRVHYDTSALEGAWRISFSQTKNQSPNYWYRNDGMIMFVDKTGTVIYQSEVGGQGLGFLPVLETLLLREFPHADSVH